MIDNKPDEPNNATLTTPTTPVTFSSTNNKEHYPEEVSNWLTCCFYKWRNKKKQTQIICTIVMVSEIGQLVCVWDAGSLDFMGTEVACQTREPGLTPDLDAMVHPVWKILNVMHVI